MNVENIVASAATNGVIITWDLNKPGRNKQGSLRFLFIIATAMLLLLLCAVIEAIMNILYTVLHVSRELLLFMSTSICQCIVKTSIVHLYWS